MNGQANGTLASIRIWAEMVKLSHTIFALPFALISAFLAGRGIEGTGRPSWGQLGLVVVCMVSARSVAMTFNRIVDAAIDARNPRTANRPIPAGRLSLAAAWMMLGVSALTFGLGCLGFYLFFRNTWPILLWGPVLLFLCGYSMTKRFTPWSHYYLGAALALSPLGAWLAVHPPSVGLPVLILMFTVMAWVGGFDILYSCQDIEIDRREGLFSLPSRLGAKNALWIARGSHLTVVILLTALGLVADLGSIYAVGVVATALLLLIENLLVRPGRYARVNLAFATLNGAVSIALATAVILDILIDPPLPPTV